jgi:hypothetical protein
LQAKVAHFPKPDIKRFVLFNLDAKQIVLYAQVIEAETSSTAETEMNEEQQEQKLTDRNSGLDIPVNEWRILEKIVGTLIASTTCADFHRSERAALLDQQPVHQSHLNDIELRLESRRQHHKSVMEQFLASITRLAAHFEKAAE